MSLQTCSCDFAGSAALVLAFGWTWADPAAASLIGALILFSSWTLLKEAVDVLMDSAPGALDTGAVRASLERSIDAQRALRGMGEVARERFGIRHCTIQPEVGARLAAKHTQPMLE